MLTFLSAVLLPMTVLSGIFGTNFALAEYEAWEPFYVMLAGHGPDHRRAALLLPPPALALAPGQEGPLMDASATRGAALAAAGWCC